MNKQISWISVNDRMLPIGKRVIHMNINTGEVNIGQVNKVGIFILGYTYVGEVEVTYWMPIIPFEDKIKDKYMFFK